MFARYWDTLRAGGGGTPELYNTCAPYISGVSVPVQGGGAYQIPATGSSYAALGTYQTPNILFPIWREYIQNQLLKKLDLGGEYCAKFYVSLVNSSQYATDKMGVYLDDGSIFTSVGNAASVTPQVESPSGVFLNDTLGWIEISGIFTANGTEKFISLGNFHNNTGTNVQLYNFSGIGHAYYYVDDVSLIDYNLPAYAGNDVYINPGDSVFIGRPPEIGLECTWYDTTGNILSSGAGMWVSPIITTTYVVEQNICGNIKRDTVTIFMKEEIFVPNAFSPNGDGENDVFKVNGNMNELHCFIFNRWGEEVAVLTKPQEGWMEHTTGQNAVQVYTFMRLLQKIKAEKRL